MKRYPLRTVVSFGTGAYALGLLVFVLLRLLVGDTWWWLALLGNFTPWYFAALLVLLPLALVSRAKRGALLMLPLALLGLLWFGRLYLPKAQASAGDAPTLRLVSFNVWGDNPDLSRIEAWLRDRQADAVVTIELPPAWAQGETIAALAEAYPDQVRSVAQGMYWGGTVLSTHPIIAHETFSLGEIPQQRIVVEIDGKPVALYGIHLYLPVGTEPHLPLSSNYVTNGVFGYDDTRQRAQIAELIQRLHDEPLPYVVAGDFNMSDQAASYGDLAAFMGDSFREAGTGLGTSWPNVQALGLPRLLPPLVRIDYIWHSSDFRAVDAAQGPYLGSDHLPLAATLALR